MLEGDEVDLDVSVQENASLVLSNPTALRIHKMDTGKAVWNQSFKIARHGFLETHPEWIIPQAHSRFEQRTRIDIESGGTLFFIEALAPGRVASGEVFSFDCFRNRLELRYDEKLTALEQGSLRPEHGSHSGWKLSFRHPFAYSIYASAPDLKQHDEFFQFIHGLNTPHLLCGSSQLANRPCWNIKILSDDPVKAKAALAAIREKFYDAAGLPTVDLRK